MSRFEFLKIKEIVFIDDSNKKGLCNSEFRNCMMHFGLKIEQDNQRLKNQRWISQCHFGE